MATAPVTVNANLNFNPASLRAAGNQVQSAFGNINLPSRAVNNFNNSLGRITGQASEFDKSINAATARVFAFGAAVSIINGISTAFKGLISSTIEVEKRLTEIGSIIGGTAEQLGKFKNAIFDVAKNTGQTFDTVANGAAELARQGLSAEETVKRLNAALILTRVSGLDAEGSVSALTAAINGFTSAGLTAEQIINKLIAVDTAFAVSAKDLAEAFSRAGSTAEDAGVSFDQLLGLVTAVQQTTARGGAVIGNAFKSIFARLGRGTVIEDLKALGVEIDQSQTGVQKLQALANAISTISDPTKANAIKELAGGVYQINIVSAALKDLSNETSIYAQASEIAAKASNEGFEKNAQLNQTLASQINSLVQGITELGSRIGELTIAPVIQNLLTGANKLLDIFNKVFDPEEGNKLIQGFFKGIGTFIAGPGLVLVSAAFFKLFQVVAKFAAQGVSDLFKIGSEQERIKNIEGGIVTLLQQDANLRATLLSSSATQAQKEQAVINAIKQQNTLLTQQQQLVNSIASAASRAGVGGFTPAGGFTNKSGKGKFAAAGYSGNVSPQEAAMEMSLASQNNYKAGEVRKSRIFDGTGSSFMGVWNSAETKEDFINASGYKSTLITPPNGFAASGFIPNYADEDEDEKKAKLLGEINKKTGKPNLGVQYLRGLATSPKGTTIAGVSFTQEQIKNEVNRRDNLTVQKKEKNKQITGTSEKRLPINGTPYGFLLPVLGESKKQFTQTINEQLAIKKGKNAGVNFDLTNLQARGPIFPIREIEGAKALKTNIGDKIQREVINAAISYSRPITGALGNPKVEKKEIVNLFDREKGREGAYGAMQGVIGSAFEAAVVASVGGDDAAPEGDNFDVNVPNDNIDTLFFGGKGKKKKYDFKVSNSKGNISSFANKIINDDVNYQTKLQDFFANKAKTKSAASGFIPNFNSLNKGIPVNKIRAHFDGMGNAVAVTNTRDEPNGLRDAIGREKKGIGAYTENMAAGGFIPNFAEEEGPKGPKAQRSIGSSLTILFGLNQALSALGGAFSGLSEEVEKEIETRDELNTKLEEEKGKDNPNIGEIKKIEQALAGLNKNIEAAEEESAKMQGLFSKLTTALNLTISAREIASQFGGGGGGPVILTGDGMGVEDVVGDVGETAKKGDNSKKTKGGASRATKVTTGSLGGFAKESRTATRLGKLPTPKIPSNVGASIGKGLVPAVTKGLGSVGPAIFNGLKLVGPLLLRGLALLTGPIGIFATVGYLIKDDVAEFISSRAGAAKELKDGKPLDDLRNTWLEANLKASQVNRTLTELKTTIEDLERKIRLGGDKFVSRTLTNTGELRAENFNKNAALGSQSQLDRLKNYGSSLINVNDIARSQKARGPQTLEEQVRVSKEKIEEKSFVDDKVLKKEAKENGKEFAIEYGKLIKDSSLLGLDKEAGTIQQRETSNQLKKVEKATQDLLSLDPTKRIQDDGKIFEREQARLQTQLSAELNSLAYEMNSGAKTEEEKEANKEFIDKLKTNNENLIAGQTKINNQSIKADYDSRVAALQQEQNILNKFVDDFNASFTKNLESFKSSVSNIKDFNVGGAISELNAAQAEKGSLSNIKDPEERRNALQGRLANVEQMTGQAESLGLTQLLTPDQLRKFKVDTFTQQTLGKETTSVRESLLNPAGAKVQEKIFGKAVRDKEGNVVRDQSTGKVQMEGGLQGDSRKAVTESLATTVRDYLEKLRQIGSESVTTGGNKLVNTVDATQALLDKQGEGTLEQLVGAITNLDVGKYGGQKGLTGSQQDAAEMVQAQALAAANQVTDIGLGENLGTAQDNLSQKTKELATLFGTLVDGIDVDKTAELPKVVETFTTNVRELGGELGALKKASAELTIEVGFLRGAAEKAREVLNNFKAAEKEAEDNKPNARGARPTQSDPQGTGASARNVNRGRRGGNP